MPNTHELRHLIWHHYGIRASSRASVEHLTDLLDMKVRTTPQYEVNQMRDQLVAFIEQHANQLALFCDGKCYRHTDATVVGCYKNFIESTEDAARRK